MEFFREQHNETLTNLVKIWYCFVVDSQLLSLKLWPSGEIVVYIIIIIIIIIINAVVFLVAAAAAAAVEPVVVMAFLNFMDHRVGLNLYCGTHIA